MGFRNAPPRPCQACQNNRRDPLVRKCIRPGSDNDDRNRALNPHHHGKPKLKFAFRLKPGEHDVYDDFHKPRGKSALKNVRVNYGMRRKIAGENHVYCFSVQLKPKSAKKFVSGWIPVTSFEAPEHNYLNSSKFKVCKFGTTPASKDCTWTVTAARPSWRHLKVTPYKPPKAPRRAPLPTDTKKVKKSLTAQAATRKRWIDDYTKHMKAGDYFAVKGYVNVVFSLPGKGGKSLGTVPVGTHFCLSGQRRAVALYKRKGTKKFQQMYFVFGHYSAGGTTVKGWIAEKALRKR